ncbi:hypothetical protein EGJ52_25280 [Pseudomonas luteola]|nr:hypothetical protein EGJ52_25280 [Pseudomonas luteola]
MRADRDDDDFPLPRKASRPERRLAWEIALGIWVGGMALIATSWVIWFFLLQAITRGLRIG